MRHRWDVSIALEPNDEHPRETPIEWTCRQCGLRKRINLFSDRVRYSDRRLRAGECIPDKPQAE